MAASATARREFLKSAGAAPAASGVNACGRIGADGRITFLVPKSTRGRTPTRASPGSSPTSSSSTGRRTRSSRRRSHPPSPTRSTR